MIQINAARLAEVTQAAFNATTGAKDARRWQQALVRARQIIESNPYVELTGDGLLMLSDSNVIYERITDRYCPCRAFQQGQPCKHRAAFRLLQRYNETAH
jgi:hypothetical protein